MDVCTAEEVAVSTRSSGTADEEFRDFMRGRWAAMVRLAYGLTGDLGHAEDVAQAAFARVYAAWGRLARAGDPDAYLRQVVINENRRRFRKQRVLEDLPGDLPDAGVSDNADDSDDRAMLLAALARLGPRQRAVVVLRYWMDMSEADTAATLNCSVGTVKSQASRALATLRQIAGVTDDRPAGTVVAGTVVAGTVVAGTVVAGTAVATPGLAAADGDIIEGGWR
jgi:RNA polymerase sigma-70 factor (sigma-E family)